MLNRTIYAGIVWTHARGHKDECRQSVLDQIEHLELKRGASKRQTYYIPQVHRMVAVHAAGEF